LFGLNSGVIVRDKDGRILEEGNVFDDRINLDVGDTFDNVDFSFFPIWDVVLWLNINLSFIILTNNGIPNFSHTLMWEIKYWLVILDEDIYSDD